MGFMVDLYHLHEQEKYELVDFPNLDEKNIYPPFSISPYLYQAGIEINGKNWVAETKQVMRIECGA